MIDKNTKIAQNIIELLLCGFLKKEETQEMYKFAQDIILNKTVVLPIENINDQELQKIKQTQTSNEKSNDFAHRNDELFGNFKRYFES